MRMYHSVTQEHFCFVFAKLEKLYRPQIISLCNFIQWYSTGSINKRAQPLLKFYLQILSKLTKCFYKLCVFQNNNNSITYFHLCMFRGEAMVCTFRRKRSQWRVDICCGVLP